MRPVRCHNHNEWGRHMHMQPRAVQFLHIHMHRRTKVHTTYVHRSILERAIAPAWCPPSYQMRTRSETIHLFSCLIPSRITLYCAPFPQPLVNPFLLCPMPMKNVVFLFFQFVWYNMRSKPNQALRCASLFVDVTRRAHFRPRVQTPEK